MKIKISKGNKKTGRIPAVSLPPGYGCPADAPCRKSCYACKSYRQYKETRAAWSGNARLQSKDRDSFFEQLYSRLSKSKPRFFRWHVSGDIPDANYLERMILLAKLLPDTKFLAFTKHYDYNYRKLPDNLKVVLSMWDNYGSLRKKMPRAWMRDPNNPDPRIPVDAVECPGNCETCGMCWNLDVIGKDVVFNKH